MIWSTEENAHAFEVLELPYSFSIVAVHCLCTQAHVVTIARFSIEFNCIGFAIHFRLLQWLTAAALLHTHATSRFICTSLARFVA